MASAVVAPAEARAAPLLATASPLAALHQHQYEQQQKQQQQHRQEQERQRQQQQRQRRQEEEEQEEERKQKSAQPLPELPAACWQGVFRHLRTGSQAVIVASVCREWRALMLERPQKPSLGNEQQGGACSAGARGAGGAGSSSGLVGFGWCEAGDDVVCEDVCGALAPHLRFAFPGHRRHAVRSFPGPPPAVLLRTAEAGNISACVCLATWNELSAQGSAQEVRAPARPSKCAQRGALPTRPGGAPRAPARPGLASPKRKSLTCAAVRARPRETQALRLRRRAARLGHAPSQLMVGRYFAEEGSPAEAAIWLQRCAANRASSRGDRAAAAMMLGYLCLDQETTYGHNTNSEACEWFKLARDSGSADAEKVLGTLWSTGQY